MSDEGIRSTNNDATHCKRWCVEKAYFTDGFISCFVPTTTPKTPEISRGYYARVQSIRLAVGNFVRDLSGQCQIISVGAGSDTLFWHLSQHSLQPSVYVEVDFPQIVMKKLKAIKKQSMLSSVIGEECEVTRGCLHSPKYHLLSMDLRDSAALSTVVSLCNLDASLPTLILSECVLCYMPPESSRSILSWASSSFSNSAFLNYEPCNMADRFGGVMIDNMLSRDCAMPGILACKTLREQEQRFLESGFSQAKAMDMNAVLATLPASDTQRVMSLEFFDEPELLVQLLLHYCLSWGWRGAVPQIKLSEPVP